MKRHVLKAFAALALLALTPINAFAHAEVRVELGFPYYVEPPPVYYEPPRPQYQYYDPPPVYYGPRFEYRDRDDRGRHRGHRGHRRNDRNDDRHEYR